ncbi:hypothetical protein CR513_17810, partial [Mucuna pruriens]
MTKDVSMFLDLNPHKGTVSLGGSGKGKIIGIGKVVKHSLITIKNVLYVKGLKYNLLSIIKNKDDDILFTTQRHENLYRINLDEPNNKKDFLRLWKTHLCDACQKRKQVKNSSKSKNVVSTSIPLALLHLDSFGPTRTLSLSGKKYGFTIIDDYFIYTWVYFISHKNESYVVFEIFCKRVQNEKKNIYIFANRSGHGKNMKMMSLRPSMKRMEFSITSLHQELLNKIG